MEVHSGEGPSALAAGLLFFLLLTSLMILRPVRDTLGLARGIESIRQLFLVTVAFALVVTPLFGWLASRVPRRWLIAAVFRICALLLLGFGAGIVLMPAGLREWVSCGYYIFHSVFNLLVVSLFWASMADHFSLAESKRLFPVIALGGSLGAIVGSLISWRLVRYGGIGWLFPPAALLLEVAVWVSFAFTRTRSLSTHSPINGSSLGGSWLAGMKAVAQSSYVLAIGGFVALNGLITTFLYFTGLRMVAAASSSPEQQTILFAHLNLWTQIATLLAQAFLAGRIMRVAGVGTALAATPFLGLCGAAILALAPTLLLFTIVNALFRAAQQGITGPAEETLFTVLNRQEKYKAKSFLDTFGYRSGDAAGAHLERVLAAFGPGLLPFALSVFGLALVWMSLGVFLGRAQNRLSIPPAPTISNNPNSSPVGRPSALPLNQP
ncbi:MAG TPA: MFS transporter [Candidatus Paceibacterota bacterium]|nr:MFS transporter [Candidatus Paceibacterota bacterium]